MTKDDLISRQPETHEERTETHACDLISRQAAIDAIEELTNRYFDRKVILAKAQDAINNLPSAQSEKRWIPVSERMPEEGKQVLVCDDGGFIYTVEKGEEDGGLA